MKKKDREFGKISSMEEKINRAYREGRISKEYYDYWHKCKAESIERIRNRTPEELEALIRMEKEANAKRLAEHEENWKAFIEEFRQSGGHVEKTEEGLVLDRLEVIPCRTTGKGDYRPYELTETEERERVFKKLIYPKEVQNMQRLPAEFVQTGMVYMADGIPTSEK